MMRRIGWWMMLSLLLVASQAAAHISNVQTSQINERCRIGTDKDIGALPRCVTNVGKGPVNNQIERVAAWSTNA